MAANFSFSEVHALLGEMTRIISVSHKNMKHIESMGALVALTRNTEIDDALKQVNDSVASISEQATRLFGDLKSAHINDALVRLRYWLNRDKRSWSELNTRTRALRDNIETELRGLLYYQYPIEQARKLRAFKVEWHSVLSAFPEIENEIFRAIDCYALQQSTASVFHSMRVAEHGLRALAKERRLVLPKGKLVEWATWHDIIKALDDEIRVIGLKKAGPTKDEALSFYSGARADLNGFKDEYRNVVMHVRADYDDVQALRALTKVHAFMGRLAEKIDHNHKRINWGKF